MTNAGLAKNVLIISSGRATYAQAGVLDELIGKVRALGKHPIVVLGPDGDDLLRVSRRLETCDIVFDPNFRGNFFSSVKAGLDAVNGASFILPLGASDKTLDFAVWEAFERALLDPETKGHVLRPVTQANERLDYPLIVTGKGLLPLKALPSTTDWLQSERIEIQDFTLPAIGP